MNNSFHHRLERLEQRVRAAGAGRVVLDRAWAKIDERTGRCIGPAADEELTEGQARAWSLAKSLIESIPSRPPQS